VSAGVLYVYAVADCAPPLGGRGLFEAPLSAITAAGLHAVVSEHERAPEPDEDTLWHHEQIVERLGERATILPMRFGSTVADAASLLSLLEGRREEFLASLERIRGAVELSVRAELSVPAELQEAAPGSSRSGKTYMLERARIRRSQLDGAERIHAPLTALARRSHFRPEGADPNVFKAAYLVDRDSVAAFAGRVGQLGEAPEVLRISCTGPWPPYSFVAERA
jgi:Gas vesicle synthesis protein GvpL/GvpF